MSTPIELTVNDKELIFNVTLHDFNAYVNAMTPTSKVAPAQNFLTRTADSGSREALRELLEIPGAVLEIAGAVLEQYKPDLNITVGKSRP